MNIKSKLESKKITDNFYINTYITYDETEYIMELDYMDSKFVAEKKFPNCQKGVDEMEEALKLYKNEQDIKKYFGL